MTGDWLVEIGWFLLVRLPIRRKNIRIRLQLSTKFVKFPLIHNDNITLKPCIRTRITSDHQQNLTILVLIIDLNTAKINNKNYSTTF